MNQDTPPTDEKPRQDAKEAGKATTARAGALHCLAQVLRRKRPLDDVLAEETEKGVLTTLEPRDRAFARAIIAMTLRRLGQIDALLGEFLDKPLPKDANRVQDLLRCGVAQLVFMDVPAHAAVDESVSLTPNERFRGLVNAVLRKAADKGKEIAALQDAPRMNTPDWLWQSWETAYGQSAARGIAEQHLAEPPLDLWVLKDHEAWAKRLDATALPTGTLRRASADVRNLMGFARGAWWVQDAAAALPVRLFPDPADTTVYDLCAAPGGKTLQLASLGTRVVALDRSAARLKRVQENLDRVHLKARLMEQDATTWQPDILAKAILLDAPCSATGTIRRHPDIAHLKSPDDIAAMVTLQDKLLDNAYERLAPGGMLIFCTCSLQPEEGPDRVERLLENRPDAERVQIDPQEIDDFEEAVTRDGDLRTLPCIWPDQGGMDGFFAARIRKKDT